MTTFADRDGWIWLDGKMLPWRDATTHVLTYSLHYGVGCFEGVRAYRTPSGTAIFRLQEHTRRLLDSAKILGMKVDWSANALDAAQCAVIHDNRLDEAYLRPMIFYGAEGMGLRADPTDLVQQIGCAAFQAADLVRMHVLAVGVEASHFVPHMDGNLLPAMIEHPHQPRIPPRPDLASQVLRRHGVIAFGDFDVAVASDDALRFLKRGKAFDGQRR